MRLRTTAILATAAFGLAIPASGLAGVSTTIGTGEKTCVLKPGADCRGVVQRWTVEHHGNLRKAKFTRADLRGVDFKGADLRNADFRGAKLRHADFRGAKLTGAWFSEITRGRKAQNGCLPGFSPCTHPNAPQPPPCNWACSNADLVGTDFTGVNLSRASFIGANLTGANLTGANVAFADFKNANLTGAQLPSGTWNATRCPNGTVTNTGC